MIRTHFDAQIKDMLYVFGQVILHAIRQINHT